MGMLNFVRRTKMCKSVLYLSLLCAVDVKINDVIKTIEQLTLRT